MQLSNDPPSLRLFCWAGRGVSLVLSQVSLRKIPFLKDCALCRKGGAFNLEQVRHRKRQRIDLDSECVCVRERQRERERERD